MKKNIKKVLIEIFIVAIALGFFVYEVGVVSPKMSKVFLSIFVFVTAFEVMLKYYKQLYLYNVKHKVLKIIGVVLLVLLMFLCIYIYFNKLYIVSLLYIVFIIGLLVYLIYSCVIDIKSIIKSKFKIFNFTLNLYLCLMSFVVILVNLIFYLGSI